MYWFILLVRLLYFMCPLSDQVTGWVSLFYVYTVCLSDWSGVTVLCSHFSCKRPNSLRHFGKKEMLAKIDLMEDWYDVPMQFDLDCIPA